MIAPYRGESALAWQQQLRWAQEFLWQNACQLPSSSRRLARQTKISSLKTPLEHALTTFVISERKATVLRSTRLRFRRRSILATRTRVEPCLSPQECSLSAPSK